MSGTRPKQTNPRSLANLLGNRGIPGPGRTRLTPEEKAERAALRAYYQWYLEHGEAIQDFERLRLRDPGRAIELAERACGAPGAGAVTLILASRESAAAVDCSLTIHVGDLPAEPSPDGL